MLGAKSDQNRRKQRYLDDDSNESGVKTRLVVGTIPYNDAGLILMINSRKYPEEWLFPKGGWDHDESAMQGAERETWEEAGVTGSAEKEILTGEIVSGGKELQQHSYFAFKILEWKEEWPEQHERDRRLFTAEEARELLKKQGRRKDRFAVLKALDSFMLVSPASVCP